jgi:hypothetical protein
VDEDVDDVLISVVFLNLMFWVWAIRTECIFLRKRPKKGVSRVFRDFEAKTLVLGILVIFA